MQREADRIKEQILTPMERFFRDKDRLSELFKAGLLSAEQFKRALERITEQYNVVTKSAEALNEEVAKPGGDFRQVQSFKRTLGVSAGDRVGTARRGAERKLLELMTKSEALLKQIRDNQGEPVLLKWEG